MLRAERNEKAKDWTVRHPELRRAISKNYKARRRAQERSGISGSELKKWSDQQDKVCFYCLDDCVDDFHLDHFKPLSRGGVHECHNLVIACCSCNLRKSAQDPYKFMLNSLANSARLAA